MPTIYVDPLINMNTNEEITLIIHFRTLPAHAAVAIAKSGGYSLSQEKAEQEVEASHLRFRRDVQRFLSEVGIPFKINHIYKTVFNGVSLSIQGNRIQVLLQSPEIAAIYANKEFKINPPYLQY